MKAQPKYIEYHKASVNNQRVFSDIRQDDVRSLTCGAGPTCQWPNVTLTYVRESPGANNILMPKVNR
jgi:hypothetical protein